MKFRIACMVAALLSLFLSPISQAAAQTSAQTASALPRLVRFGGTVKDLNGNPLTDTVGITFALYSEQTGGAALWLETQNVTADRAGHYTALLGSTKPEGLPADLFTSEQARWVGVQISGQAEQPRVLLVSAPYALKAGDAETIGGLPPSAFVLAAPVSSGGAGSTSDSGTASTSGSAAPAASSDVTTTGGTVNTIPLFSTATNIQNSILTQTAATAVNVGGKLNLPATAAASKTAGTGSRPLDFVASSFSSTSSTAVNQTFQWQAEAAANDTASPSGTLNLLYGLGTATPTETGLKVSSKGLVTFATGQTFPGTGTLTGITTAAGSGLSGGGTKGTLSLKVPAAGITNAMLADSKITLNNNTAGGLTTPGAMTLGSTYTIGLKACAANQILQYSGTAWNCVAPSGTGTITGVTAGTDLTGGGTGGKVTLNVDTTKVPQLSAANTFTGNQIVKGTVTATSFIGNGSGLSNVTAANANELAGLAGSAYAKLGASNTFTVGQTIEGASAFSGGNSTGPMLSVSNSGGTVYASAITATNSGSYGPGIYASAGSGAWGIESYGTQTAGSIGVFGSLANSNGFSNSFGLLNDDDGLDAGVWADGPGGQESALIATSDDLTAGIFFNDSAASSTILVLNNYAGGPTGNVARGIGTVLRAEGPGGVCGINQTGTIACTGQVKTLATTQNGARQVETYSVQSAENWLEDYGSGQLNHGGVTINLDPVFADTVNTGVDFHVFLTPGGDCKGLYVTNKTASSFEVHELGGGTTSIPFDYKIVAKRRGHEAERLVDVTDRMRLEANAARFKRPAKGLPRRMMRNAPTASPAASTPVNAAKTGNVPTGPSAKPQRVPKMAVLPSRPESVMPELLTMPANPAAAQPAPAQPK